MYERATSDEVRLTELETDSAWSQEELAVIQGLFVEWLLERLTTGELLDAVDAIREYGVDQQPLF